MQVNVGKGIELDIDASALPQAALDHVIYIGLRNVLMDSHASITTDEYPDARDRDAAARAMVQKKLDALMQGIVRVSSSREGDPVRAEAKRMATAIVTAKIKKAGKRVKDYEPAAITAAVNKLITPELLAQAKERVDNLPAAGGDLAELGL